MNSRRRPISALLPVLGLLAATSLLIAACTSAPVMPASNHPSARASGTAAATVAGSPTAGGTAITPSTSVHVVACAGRTPQIVPSTLVLTCSDGGRQLTGLTWDSWTPDRASGTGTLEVNDCTPDCTGGTVVSHSASVVLSAPSGFDGVVLFTRVQVSAPGATPPTIDQQLPG